MEDAQRLVCSATGVQHQVQVAGETGIGRELRQRTGEVVLGSACRNRVIHVMGGVNHAGGPAECNWSQILKGIHKCVMCSNLEEDFLMYVYDVTIDEELAVCLTQETYTVKLDRKCENVSTRAWHGLEMRRIECKAGGGARECF